MWHFVTKTKTCPALRSMPAGGHATFVRLVSEDHTHSLSWLLSRASPIPLGKMVLHRCHNRACVRPAHLYLGSHTDNMRDMRDAGRARWGGFSILRPAQVRAVFRAWKGGALQRELALKYGVARHVIADITSGRSWTKETGSCG